MGADQREGWADGKGLFLRRVSVRSVEDAVYIAGLLVCGVKFTVLHLQRVKYGGCPGDAIGFSVRYQGELLGI